jgi:hypothetical protein
MQGSPDLCASALTTAPRGRQSIDEKGAIYKTYSNCGLNNPAHLFGSDFANKIRLDNPTLPHGLGQNVST